MEVNAALMLPTQQKLFQMNRISQNPCHRSRQLTLALAILKSREIIFELLWIERVPLSVVKDLGISAFLLSLLSVNYKSRFDDWLTLLQLSQPILKAGPLVLPLY